MRVLVTYGSKHGSTAGIAEIIGRQLRAEGFDCDVAPAARAGRLGRYDAAIIGGALYANRWHRDARRFVVRHLRHLRHIPVWLFSSGPPDDSASHSLLPPPPQVAVLGDRLGAVGHIMFGGRMSSDARGYIARSLAQTSSGDWRDPERVRRWAHGVARSLPEAHPREPAVLPGRAPWRIAAHALVGWMVCALVFAGLVHVTTPQVASALHAVAGVAVFAAVSIHYFRARGAFEALPAAFIMTALVATLDAGTLRHVFFTGLALILVTTAITGYFVSMLPWPHPPRAA